MYKHHKSEFLPEITGLSSENTIFFILTLLVEQYSPCFSTSSNPVTKRFFCVLICISFSQSI